MTVSVVIPTKDRRESLLRLLRSLRRQTVRPVQTIVVEAGNEPLGPGELQEFTDIGVRVIRSEPSVCHQRNTGIRAATSDLTFLCDDDMEPDADYVETLATALNGPVRTPIATGLIREAGTDGILRSMPQISFRRLVWNFLFGGGVWADLEELIVFPLFRPVLSSLRRYYRAKGNSHTAAGWPLVTQVRGGSFRTEVYGLGVCMARTELFRAHPFSVSLDPKGIGDNFVFIHSLRQSQPITVVTSTGAVHHRLSGTGLPDPERYARRILVLDAVLTLQPHPDADHRPYLIRSLYGNLIAFIIHTRWELARATHHVIGHVRHGSNPYVAALRTDSPAPEPLQLPPQ